MFVRTPGTAGRYAGRLIARALSGRRSALHRWTQRGGGLGRLVLLRRSQWLDALPLSTRGRGGLRTVAPRHVARRPRQVRRASSRPDRPVNLGRRVRRSGRGDPRLAFGPGRPPQRHSPSRPSSLSLQRIAGAKWSGLRAQPERPQPVRDFHAASQIHATRSHEHDMPGTSFRPTDIHSLPRRCTRDPSSCVASGTWLAGTYE